MIHESIQTSPPVLPELRELGPQALQVLFHQLGIILREVRGGGAARQLGAGPLQLGQLAPRALQRRAAAFQLVLRVVQLTPRLRNVYL